MAYEKPLPSKRQLLYLAKLVHFPATCREIAVVAMTYGFSELMTDFLGLFPNEEMFKNSAEFIDRCEELEILIDEERLTPKDPPSNPLD